MGLFSSSLRYGRSKTHRQTDGEAGDILAEGIAGDEARASDDNVVGAGVDLKTGTDRICNRS